jgi:UDP-N-acetylglucosamine 2-epimerase (non-hydrolysing)
VRIVSVVGARPNFVKLAPVARALAARRAAGVEHIVVHTGQHYDALMSDAFFTDLAIPAPDHNLGVGSGAHGQQTAAVLAGFEPLCAELRPDWVLVYGDVNSTVAAALAAVKLGVRVAHVEAGLRSRDRTMPEEHNRVVTDHLADLLLTPSRDAIENLRQEGIPAKRIAFVGNVMIDSLEWVLPRARALDTARSMKLAAGEFVLVTLHRPSNVDDPAVFGPLCDALADIARARAVVFPIHPRSRGRLAEWGLAERLGSVRLVDPVPYLAMLSLTESAGLVITDSGGVQEETTHLGVPCLTVRPNTERPITIAEGTNRLVASTRADVVAAARNGKPRGRQDGARRPIERWDGRAGERIAEVLVEGKRYD